MNNRKILVVDDDPQILEFIAKLLKQHQFEPLIASDSKRLSQYLKDPSEISLIVLDVMLNDADGIALCKDIRANSSIPIILLTANTSEVDRIMGLEFGADDYIHKPFNPRELIARIQTVLRRTAAPVHSVETVNLPKYSFSGWSLNTSVRELINSEGVEVPLTSAEYQLLLTFLQRPKRVLSRDSLLELTKNAEAEAFDRTIDVLVSRLRRKLGDNSKSAKMIKTVHGGGYMFAATVELM